jgi:hypothetical protein
MVPQGFPGNNCRNEVPTKILNREPYFLQLFPWEARGTIFNWELVVKKSLPVEIRALK